MYDLRSSENYFSVRIENYVWLIQVSTAWGIGLIIGPALGGFLAQVLQCFDLVCWQIHVAASFSFSSFCSKVLMFLLIFESACREISKFIFKRISVWKVSEFLLLSYSFELFSGGFFRDDGLLENVVQISLFLALSLHITFCFWGNHCCFLASGMLIFVIYF